VLFRWKQELKPSAVPTFVTVQIADASAPFDATPVRWQNVDVDRMAADQVSRARLR
jgi:hypothetical protein